MKYRPTFFRVFGIILSLCASLPAQEKQVKSVNENLRMQEVSSQVFFHASVWDKSAKGFVKGLTSKDFSIVIDRKPQEISFFQEADFPATVGIMFDVSGSMTGETGFPKAEMERGVDGLNTFIENSNPNNKYFLVAFSEEPSLIQETTSDREKIETAFVTLSTKLPKSNTRFFPSMKYCVEKLTSESGQKKILLIVSDGISNSIKLRDYTAVRDYVRQNGIVIYMINHQRSFIQYLDGAESSPLIEKIAKESGGRVLYPSNVNEQRFSFALLASELRNQYLIGFVPKSNQKLKWNGMKIKLNGAFAADKLRINAPSGYLYQ